MINISLDLETSGLEVSKHGILSIGMHYRDEYFYEEMSLPQGVEVQYEAMQVNKLRLDPHRMLPTLADMYAREWLETLRVEYPEDFTDQKDIRMMGWNVGGFDKPFLQRWMPNTHDFFNYRVWDLTTHCDAVARGVGIGGKQIREALKKRAGAWADAFYNMAEIPYPKDAHNALYDAVVGTFVFEGLNYYMNALTSGKDPFTGNPLTEEEV